MLRLLLCLLLLWRYRTIIIQIAKQQTHTHNTAESNCVEADLTNNNVLTGQPQPCPEGKATADNQSTAKDSDVNKQRQHQLAKQTTTHNTKHTINNKQNTLHFSCIESKPSWGPCERACHSCAGKASWLIFCTVTILTHEQMLHLIIAIWPSGHSCISRDDVDDDGFDDDDDNVQQTCKSDWRRRRRGTTTTTTAYNPLWVRLATTARNDDDDDDSKITQCNKT